MRYIVEINAKHLVSIDAETPLQAEHKALSYTGIWGALAYDRGAMKTDTFAGAVQTCDMVSMTELVEMVNTAEDARKAMIKHIDAAKEAAKRVDELSAMLDQAKQELKEAERSRESAIREHEKAVDILGKERR